MAIAQRDRGIPALISVSIFGMSAEIRTVNPLSKFLECYLYASLFVCSGNCLHTCIYRVIQNDCRGFNNLSYTIHLI